MANPALSAWLTSLDTSVETGEVFSQAFPLSDPPALANGREPYPGRLVLITDALCYSAADIFAAGFQDNGLGAIVGTDAHTGAGGAMSGRPTCCDVAARRRPAAAAGPATFRVAFRRVTRTGPAHGACRWRISASSRTASTGRRCRTSLAQRGADRRRRPRPLACDCGGAAEARHQLPFRRVDVCRLDMERSRPAGDPARGDVLLQVCELDQVAVRRLPKSSPCA